MDRFDEFVPDVYFEKIPIKNLVSNQDYQRNLSQARIEQTAAQFDLYQINPVKVSRRDGVNYVFNGQHTIEIVAKVSGSRETPVWCMIYDDLNYSHEADIFANQMKFVKNLQPHEIFNAKIEAGSQEQLIIRDLVASFGMTISHRRGPGVISAVAALEFIYSKYGIHVLRRTIRLIIATWEGDVNSFSSNMLKAVAIICVRFLNELDENGFKEKLGAISIKQLSRTAHDRRGGCMGFAEAMVIAYNGKKKTAAGKLSLNKLYAKDIGSLIDSDDEDEDYFDDFDYENPFLSEESDE